ARRLGADLVVASDPDGDRLAVAVPDPAGGAAAGGGSGWRVLTGDQVGALLGASLLDRSAGQAAPEARLVASTVVSSTLLSKIADDCARAHGVHLTSQRTLRTAGQAQVMSRLRAAPPETFGGEAVSGLTDLAAGSGTVPRADVLIFRLADGRVVLRPSGTEPK